MRKAQTVGEMLVQMRETLDAFEDDSSTGLGIWVHAVPLLGDKATEEQHHKAVQTADKGRQYRRMVRGWIAEVETGRYDQEAVAR